jgi:SAM-dependent methyltransferase
MAVAVADDRPRFFERAARAVIYRAPGELERCPACDSSRLVALRLHKLAEAIAGRRIGFISGCEECGLVFVNPLPSADALASMYGPQGEWGLARIDDRAAASDGESTAGSGTWPRLFDAIQGDLDVTRPPAGSRVLDFGCGRGKFLDVLQRCGWSTFGIEPSLDTAFSRHQRLTTLPTEPTFDLVIAHHVLEHVTNPLAILRQIAAATRPGGYLFVAVPRLDTLPVHGDYRYVLSRVHVTAYTSTCMEGLLSRAGWKIVEAPRMEVPISRGRRTTARLRILARRTDGPLRAPGAALRPARAALRAYDAQAAPRPMLERLGAVRLSARVAESRRQLKKLAGVLRMVSQHVAR